MVNTSPSSHQSRGVRNQSNPLTVFLLAFYGSSSYLYSFISLLYPSWSPKTNSIAFYLFIYKNLTVYTNVFYLQLYDFLVRLAFQHKYIFDMTKIPKYLFHKLITVISLMTGATVSHEYSKCLPLLTKTWNCLQWKEAQHTDLCAWGVAQPLRACVTVVSPPSTTQPFPDGRIRTVRGESPPWAQPGHVQRRSGPVSWMWENSQPGRALLETPHPAATTRQEEEEMEHDFLCERLNW